MAEAIASGMAENAGLSISSAGLSAWEGSPASPDSIKCAKNLGLSLENHKSRMLTQHMLDEAELVLTMTKAHKEYIESVFANVTGKIYTIGEFIGEDSDISDPYSLDLKAYEQCAGELSRLIKIASKKWNL